MGKALYRKYRSRKLSEIVGQEHITTTLDNALKKGKISHAYLFTGPRGVGKTSIARILAHEVNGLDYQDETNHLDIIEIDAASNRRIDEIRELRERVHTAPASSKYKVYIIDEVHMLTREAFNALLKTLEEPPAHVIFILATTESHKLPETIISRTQRFSFKPVEGSAAIDHLENIAKQEGISISRDALELVAAHGEGSFRDSISLLDQISGMGKEVNLDDVRITLGIAPSEIIQDILSAVKDGDLDTLSTLLGKLREQGYQATNVAKQISALLRQKIIANDQDLESGVLKSLLRELLDVGASHDPDGLLEITLLTAAAHNPTKPMKTDMTDSKSQKAAEKTPKPKPLNADVAKPEKAKVEKEVQPGTTGLDADAWQRALATLKQRYSTLYGVARMANPRFEDATLYLGFTFPFHMKRLDDAKNKQIISDILRDESGTEVTIICELDFSNNLAEDHKPTSDTASDDPIATISNIFGSVEMLE